MDFSSGNIFVMLIVSSVGLSFLIYGKKQKRTPQLIFGAALSTYPYFVQGAMPMLAIGAGLFVGFWFALRLGW